MKMKVPAALLLVSVLLAGCGNSGAKLDTQEAIQESVQDFYNKVSELEVAGKEALESFNGTIAAYTEGKADETELEKAIDSFQSATADIREKAAKLEVDSGLPDDVEQLMDEAKTSFQEAYKLKAQASDSVDSADVTAEQFDEMNKNADIVMLYGISKLKEARSAVGLDEEELAPSATP
ncbi:hypothetical protein ACE6ED_10015 [Paenibacillus sp. CN-4]|uniref:hypothetical protein n=1 Tax=Paenibacillus nanchangensis TaxID=3348343 RepID=UPI00397DA352